MLSTYCTTLLGPARSADPSRSGLAAFARHGTSSAPGWRALEPAAAFDDHPRRGTLQELVQKGLKAAPLAMSTSHSDTFLTSLGSAW